jgi:hypothetical protein
VARDAVTRMLTCAARALATRDSHVRERVGKSTGTQLGSHEGRCAFEHFVTDQPFAALRRFHS